MKRNELKILMDLVLKKVIFQTIKCVAFTNLSIIIVNKIEQ